MTTLQLETLTSPGGRSLNIPGSKDSIEIPDCLQVLKKTDQPIAGRGTFRILSAEYGDKRVTWDSRVLAEIKAARDMFISLVKKGLKPFRVGTNGKATAEVMREFDPRAEEVIFLPSALVAGG